MISVRINNLNDFQRVLTIAQARRSRMERRTGAREFINDGSTAATSEQRKNRIMVNPIHPTSHLVITIEATTPSSSRSSSSARTLTAVSLASGVLPSPAGPGWLKEELERSVALCQQTLTTFHRVMLSVASNENFHTFRHSKLTSLLQTPLLTSSTFFKFLHFFIIIFF